MRMKITKIFLICFAALFFGPPSMVFSNECSIEDMKRPWHKQRRHFCTSYEGQYVSDDYTDGNKILCEDMEVDHCISISWARKNGVCGANLQKLAKDPRNLKKTYWLTNRKKGAKGLHVFADTLPPKVKKKVLSECEPLLKEYSIYAERDLMSASLARYGSSSLKNKTKSVPYYLLKDKVSKSKKEKLSIKRISGKSIVFIGKRVVGYAVGVGAAIEVVTFVPSAMENIAYWAADPNDMEKARNDFFKKIIEDW